MHKSEMPRDLAAVLMGARPAGVCIPLCSSVQHAYSAAHALLYHWARLR